MISHNNALAGIPDGIGLFCWYSFWILTPGSRIPDPL
jgi:hypothetical protein